MKFDELYSLVVEQENSVVEEGFLNKLKILSIGAFFGIVAGKLSFDQYEKQVTNELKNNPEQIQQAYKYANDMAKEISRTLPPEVKNQIAKADTSTSVGIIQNAIEEKPKPKPIQKQIVPVDPKQQAAILSDIKNYIRFHEIGNQGIRNSSYKDSKGYSTIGIGHLVLDSEVGRGKLFTPDEISYKTIKGLKRKIITISDKKAEQIFYKDFNSKVAIAKSKFPSLFKYPAKLQKVILDTFFRGDLSSSKRAPQAEARANIRTAMTLFFKYADELSKGHTAEAQELLEKGKEHLEIAADKYLEHPDNHDGKKDGVDIRMKKNAALIRSALDEYSIPNQNVNPEYTPNF
jgi:hypothetical protein